MVAEAQAAARPAVDGPVQALKRSFERAGVHAALDPVEQSWVEAALAAYRTRASLYGRLGKPDAGPWERIETRALTTLDRGEATYVALVEVRQAPDGHLLDLRLLASSGTREFDVRALGSVAHGVLADAAPLLNPRPDGALSLWALLGDRKSSPAVENAKTAARYLLLDVVDLKDTVVELERGGSIEHLKFSARLLGTF